MNSICLQILNIEKEFSMRKDLIANPRVMMEILNVGVVGYFDGAAKDGLCVAGVVLWIKNSHGFNFQLHCGTSSRLSC